MSRKGPYNYFLKGDENKTKAAYTLWLRVPYTDSKSKEPPTTKIGEMVFIGKDETGKDKWVCAREFYEKYGRKHIEGSKDDVGKEMVQAFIGDDPNLKMKYTRPNEEPPPKKIEPGQPETFLDALDRIKLALMKSTAQEIDEAFDYLADYYDDDVEDQYEDVKAACPGDELQKEQLDKIIGSAAIVTCCQMPSEVGPAQGEVVSSKENRISGEESTFDKYIWPEYSSHKLVRQARKRYKEGFLDSEARTLRNRILICEEDKPVFFAYVVGESGDDEIRNMLLSYRIDLGPQFYYKPMYKWRIIVDRLGWETADMFKIPIDLNGNYYTLDEVKREIVRIKSRVVECVNRWDAPYVADLLIRFQSERRPFRYEHVVKAAEEMGKETYSVVLEA